jgi:non-ribosomal peptide synthetase component E (peptide arylation enzyme)
MDWNFADAFESVSDALPERPALIQGDRRIAWGAFDDRAARLAQALTTAGLTPGSKVASYLYNCNEYSEGVYATFKMRGVPVRRASCGATKTSTGYWARACTPSSGRRSHRTHPTSVRSRSGSATRVRRVCTCPRRR